MIEDILQTALKHHESGRLPEAEALYRQILAGQPQHPDALHLLGVVATQTGHAEAAADLISRAIAGKQDDPAFHSNLGEAFRFQKRSAEAIACYRRALALKPDYPEALNNLGLALTDTGQWEEAATSFGRALALKPELSGTHSNIGNALAYQGRFEEAIAAFERDLAFRPDYAEAHNNRGNALASLGRVKEAADSFERALALKPDYHQAHYNMGNLHKSQNLWDEAIASYEQAIMLKPDYSVALNNKGILLGYHGRQAEAIDCFQRAMALAPTEPAVHSNLLFALQLDPIYRPQDLLEQNRTWNQQHGEPRRRFMRPHANNADPKRRLKIGYVSPDFCIHTVGFFLLPLLENHDHEHFEIICYADVPRPDALTTQLRACTDRWHNTAGISEEALTEQIRSDAIDILVDLTVHTAHNRLPVFARKPAPIQVSFAGYPGTTGLDAIDYRLSDPFLNPPNQETHSSEEVVRLPDSFWLFAPPEGGPEVSPLPALTAGHVTFGGIGYFGKINESVLALWARTLRAVPGSRLLLLTRKGSHRARLLDTLKGLGIAKSRVGFLAPCARTAYYAMYHKVDICLDTFPYNGHNSTLDALWMGAPVVSLIGETEVGRGGLSILSNAGLPELAVETEEDYVKTVVELTHDLPRLAKQRAALRGRMLASPLLNAPRFVQNIEDAYRTMWGKWCEERNKNNSA